VSASAEFAALNDDDLQQRLDRLEKLRELRLAEALDRTPWEPFEHQLAPSGDWYLWLLLAGRGAGKTDACAYYFDRFMRRNPGARGGIAAPTLGDAAEACVFGPSGLLAHNPRVKFGTHAGGTYVRWPNDATAQLFGAYTKQDVERFRARGNRHIYWCEELAAWRYLREAWENMELGLRQGRNPHVIASTTPRTRPFLKRLTEAPDTVLTRATIHDNPALPDVTRRRLIDRYGGTRLEAQELLGEYIEEVEGALWTYETIARWRVRAEDVPDLARVVVAIDPSGGDEDGNDEQGIIVAGRGVDGQGYVLADRSCKLSPGGWSRRAIHAYEEFKADRVVGEVNFGGDLVIHTVKTTAQDMDMVVATKKLSASRGKVARAEPISALYEQGRVHHVGEFPELESQMRSWTDDSGWSPDRMDALVWALTELMVTGRDGRTGTSAVPQGQIPGVRQPVRGIR